MFGKRFPHIQQLDSTDCGPSCLRMVAQYYGKQYTQQTISNLYQLNRQGISLQGLSKVAEKIGFQTLCVRVDFEKLCQKAPFPVIAHWNQNHYVVVYKVKGNKIYVSDPEAGQVQYTRQEFLEGWAQGVKDGREEGVLLLLEPTSEFFEKNEEPIDKSNFGFLFKYLFRYKYYMGLILAGLLIGSIFQLVFPFLTQAIVDKGIGNRNIEFIYVVLAAQLIFYVSNVGVEFIRSWILIHISSRINVYIISDFLVKLMRLPIRYFDSRLTGDLIQRIRDHKRIEQFITDSLLKSLFAVFSLLVGSAILAYFNWKVFLVFVGLTALEMVWIFFFLKKQRVVDNQSFTLMARDQGKLMEMVNGMQEIKLNNIENRKRWEWETLQASLFSVNVKKLKLNQYQDGGSRFFGYVQFVLILFISCMAVLNNQMTLGTLLAIIFIIGELNKPISHLINFIISAQYARLSLERLNEIHQRPDEEKQAGNTKATALPAARSIIMQNVSFSYGSEGRKVLEDIHLMIPEGKVTAIVGVSGSGKTTLLKILLKFYTPTEGTVKVGNLHLDNIHSNTWRQHCGTVMQDSFLFSDTIANNIALEEPIDKRRLLQAVEVANIREFIESLPMEYNTRVGQEGLGLSQGQKQRLLIARAVYKDPEYLFFDEATNALDANNEKVIMRNLNEFFQGKTVLIVAHRLSTVKNADQIIVIDKGRIVEFGSHEELVYNKSNYYGLVRNQLELGV